MTEQAPQRFRGWIIAGLVAGFAALFGGLWWWIARTPNGALRAQLATGTFYFLEVTFVLLVVAAVAARKHLWRFARSLGGSTWLKLAAIALLAFLLTTQIAPRTNRIFYDEDIYQEQGVNLALLHRAQLCQEANIEFGRMQCNRWEYNKWPSGYPYLLSLLYRAFGVQEKWSFTLNNLNAALIVLWVFGVAFLLFGDRRAGLLAALAMATIPMSVMWGNTAAVEPTAAGMAALTLMLWLLFAREGKTSLLLLATAATALAMQFRMESILLAPLAALTLLLLRPRTFLELRFWAIALLGGVLVIPLVGHTFAVSNEPWGTVDQARFSLIYLPKNMKSNLLYHFANREFPLAVTLLALLGIGWVGKWRQRLIAFAWFAFFWGIFLLFYAGSYDYGADIRYSLVSYAPLAVLAGFGASSLAGFIRKKRNVPAHAIVALIVLANLFCFLPMMRAEGEEAWEARLDHEYARELVEMLPDNSLIFTHNPNMFILWGQSAAQMFIAANENPETLDRLYKRYAGGLYLHWNYWCNVNDPKQVRFCERVRERFDVQGIDSKRWWRVRYGLYKLERLKPPAPPAPKEPD